MNGWIKIHRKMLDWEWYTDTNTTRVFLHLLLSANFEDKRFRGKEVKRGQVIIGRHSLADTLGLSEQSVRTAINHLISTNEITIETTNKFTIVTICKYENYQVFENQDNQQINKQDNQQSTNNQPTTNQQLTTTKEYKKERNKEDKRERGDKSPRTQFTKPTLEECISYCAALGLSTYFDGINKSAARLTAEKFHDHFESNGWKVGGRTAMKDWKSALRNWVRRDAEFRQRNNKSDEQIERENEFYYRLFEKTGSI